MRYLVAAALPLSKKTLAEAALQETPVAASRQLFKAIHAR
jgi:hypothetical protein